MVEVKVINKSNNPLPKYETPLSAGMDVRADFSRITTDNPIRLYGDGEFKFATDDTQAMLRLEVGSRVLIPTGLFSGIPAGYEIQVRPRSGLALKKGISLVNTPGTIN